MLNFANIFACKYFSRLVIFFSFCIRTLRILIKNTQCTRDELTYNYLRTLGGYNRDKKNNSYVFSNAASTCAK